MAIDRRRAARDLSVKVRLETILARERLDVQRRVSRSAARQVAMLGRADVRDRSADLTREMLVRHYDRTRREFDSTIRAALPPDVAMTGEEADQVDATLAAALSARADEQSRAISATDQANVERGLFVAQSEQARLSAQQSRVVGGRELAVIAASVASTLMAARLAGIIAFETQAPAELSKEVEARTLLGLPSLPDPGITFTRSVKDWVSQGDSRVRPAHLAADLEDPIPSSQPFVVGGERLMYPGDTSLGASLGNVIGCRCSAVHDVEEIAAVRRSE